MARILPSDVVLLMDRMFPGGGNVGGYVTLTSGNLTEVATILGVVEQVPRELLVLSSENYTGLLAAISALRAAVGYWQSGDARHMLAQISGFGGAHVLSLIRRAMSACPDESTASVTNALSFIEDVELREALQFDMSAVDRALSNGDWKATTVLAGSVVEALLLWVLQHQAQGRLKETAHQLYDKGVLKRNVPSNPEEWNLAEYIEVASTLKLIGTDTANQARLAKDYRNLIHPGREQRLGRRCDRGAALAAVSAVLNVARDLTESSRIS